MMAGAWRLRSYLGVPSFRRGDTRVLAVMMSLWWWAGVELSRGRRNLA
jgi:hypothetical protein